MTEQPSMTPAGRRIVAAAEELFYELGITAVGVDLIAERSGVTKRTLYNRFGSKDRLVATYLAERDRRWRSVVRAAVDDSAGPAAAVVAPFEALRTWSEAGSRGCAFINALAELPDRSHPAYDIAVDQKLWLRGLFGELASAAGCVDPTKLAARLLVLHEGAVAVQHLTFGPLTDSIDLARELVGDALARREEP